MARGRRAGHRRLSRSVIDRWLDSARSELSRRSQSLAVSFLSEMIAPVKLTATPSVESVTDDVVGFLSHLKKSGEAHILGVAAGLDLSFSQLRAMFVLADCQDEPAVHELAGRLGLSMVTAGRAVQALTRADLVTRREDERDRRVKRVKLSEHGRALVAGFVHAHREAVRECVESLSDREREQLAKALTPILARGDQSATTTAC
ncbi:MAG: winged helix DNA-binding protein [Actinophytocola sp.]|nr:winged helix DNA-binding protein [Actinophytocola sp.]